MYPDGFLEQQDEIAHRLAPGESARLQIVEQPRQVPPAGVHIPRDNG
jgi:hypothetical protein